MEYLILTETGIYQERDHVLEKGMLNCLSGTASKQRTSKATSNLTELAVPTLLPLQCLPLPHLTVTKIPQGPPLFSNLKSPGTALQCRVYPSEEHIRPKIKGKMFPGGEMVSCK